MNERHFKILERALKGIELTEEETRFMKWISGWDDWTVQRFVRIIKKCREADNWDFIEGIIMVKRYGTMMSGYDALKLLAKIEEIIENKKQDKELRENLERMNHRFEYLVDQSKPIKPIYHKGIYGRKYDSWTCGNCGSGINYDVIQNYCWSCGHAIKWDSIRCLTK